MKHSVESSREFGIRVRGQPIRASAMPVWGYKCGNTGARDKSSRNKGSEDEMSRYESLVWIRVCNHEIGKQLQERTVWEKIQVSALLRAREETVGAFKEIKVMRTLSGFGG